MSDFGDSMRALGVNLNAKFGIDATLHHASSGAYSATTQSATVSFTDDACKSSPPLEADFRMVQGGVVPANAVRALIFAETVDSAPEPRDELTLAGVRYTVESVSALVPDDGAAAAYDLHCVAKNG